MAIILPEACRGLSAGVMRQIKEQGYSTNTVDGGVFSTAYVKNLIVTGNSSYLRKNEPLGKFMTALEQAQKDIEGTTAAVSASARIMVNESEVANAKLTEASRKMRDATEKLGAQMQKFNAIFTGAHFAEQSKAAQSLADAIF